MVAFAVPDCLLDLVWLYTMCVFLIGNSIVCLDFFQMSVLCCVRKIIQSSLMRDWIVCVLSACSMGILAF